MIVGGVVVGKDEFERLWGEVDECIGFIIPDGIIDDVKPQKNCNEGDNAQEYFYVFRIIGWDEKVVVHIAKRIQPAS